MLLPVLREYGPSHFHQIGLLNIHRRLIRDTPYFYLIIPSQMSCIPWSPGVVTDTKVTQIAFRASRFLWAEGEHDLAVATTAESHPMATLLKLNEFIRTFTLDERQQIEDHHFQSSGALLSWEPLA